jgi:putative transcriptional regulator
VKITPNMVDRAVRQTDWAAQDALTDVATAASIVRTVRKRLGISQTAFAARYHIPIGTLRDWEQDRKRVDAPSQAYLRVIAREP